jgi:hypothetical protein
MVVQINRAGAESAVPPADLLETLRLPDEHVVLTKTVEPDDVWPLVDAVRDALETHLEAAVARGLIPQSGEST